MPNIYGGALLRKKNLSCQIWSSSFPIKGDERFVFQQFVFWDFVVWQSHVKQAKHLWPRMTGKEESSTNSSLFECEVFDRIPTYRNDSVFRKSNVCCTSEFLLDHKKKNIRGAIASLFGKGKSQSLQQFSYPLLRVSFMSMPKFRLHDLKGKLW